LVGWWLVGCLVGWLVGFLRVLLWKTHIWLVWLITLHLINRPLTGLKRQPYQSKLVAVGTVDLNRRQAK